MKMIPYTNLLLVAVDTTEEETCYFLHTTAIRDIVYENETTFPCQKLYLNDLIRKPLQGCFNEHYLVCIFYKITKFQYYLISIFNEKCLI